MMDCLKNEVIHKNILENVKIDTIFWSVILVNITAPTMICRLLEEKNLAERQTGGRSMGQMIIITLLI